MNLPNPTDRWFTVQNAGEIPSPALLFYQERIEENVRRMISIAGNPDRLRPHAKTHKTREIAALQVGTGIKKFKCATISEAEMLALAGAADVLLAMQMVGPNRARLFDLIKQFPKVEFATLVDDAEVAAELARDAAACQLSVGVFLDLDCGQHRTGIEPCDAAAEIYQFLCSAPGLKIRGLHAYDGHIHTGDPLQRERECTAAFIPVSEFRERLERRGLSVDTVVAGGTPTFPMHARRQRTECSPGTCVLWDHGYSSRFPDLDFLHAAVVLTRVVSKPSSDRVCLDLGHKSIASENPPPRVHFLNLPNASALSHSEEHLVIESSAAHSLKPGDVVYGIPRHICPTVALYDDAHIVRHQRLEETWKITARGRRISL